MRPPRRRRATRAPSSIFARAATRLPRRLTPHEPPPLPHPERSLGVRRVPRRVQLRGPEGGAGAAAPRRALERGGGARALPAYRDGPRAVWCAERGGGLPPLLRVAGGAGVG